MSAVAEYHRDAESSLRLYFTDAHPDFDARFVGYTRAEVQKELADRIDETDLRSALAIMSRIEALFRIDYRQRCKKKLPDGISTLQKKSEEAFRIIEQRLRALEDRMIRLEADERQIVTEARSAAAAASTIVAGAIISDAVTRITRLEGRADQLERKQLPPPA
jgi:hypothetical protein